MKRILVVDDEEMIVRTVRAYLEREGFKTYAAYDGEQALREVEDKNPDLIVLDLMLPKMSGIDVTKRIRSHSNVPIIMLTAKAAETDRVIGLELGADDYVVKPFSPVSSSPGCGRCCAGARGRWRNRSGSRPVTSSSI